MNAPGLIAAAFADRYDVHELVAEDDVTHDYLAFDRDRESLVLLRVIAAAVPHDARFRFLRNAPLLEGWNHPNVQTVIESGQRADYGFVVTRHWPGELLDDLLTRTPILPVPNAVRIAIDVLKGLEAVHARNIVHRDVTPRTVLVTREHAIVAGFPLYMLANSAPKFIGNVCYCAPEQVINKPSGVATDVYMVGGLLYRMLTGRLAFEGSTARETMMAIMTNERPRPSSLRSVPAELDAIVVRAMAVEPRDRYETVSQFLADLEQPMLREQGGHHAGIRLTTPEESTRALGADPELPLDYRASFSEDEIAVIRRGLQAPEMEDKWRIHMEGDWLHLDRSWTGITIYRVRVEPRGDRHQVVEALVNANGHTYRRHTDEYEVALLDFLIRGLMLGQDLAFPLPADLDAPEEIFQHHVAGSAFPTRRVGWWTRLKSALDNLLATDVTRWLR